MDTIPATTAELLAVERPARATRTGVAYLRYSRLGSRSRKSLITLIEQRRTIARLAAERGVTVVTEYTDEGRSAKTVDTRPEFEKALDDVLSGRVQVILVATLDRFSRSVSDFLELLGAIEAAGGALLCGDGDVSLQGGTDAMMATMRVAFAAFELAQRTEYMAKTVRNAIDRGVHLNVPFGYRRSGGRGSKLELEPAEAKVVELIFLMRADEGLSWPKIADALNAAGTLPRPYFVGDEDEREERQALWTQQGVRKLVFTDTYLGVAYSGKHRHEGAHPAIVTADLAERARRAKGVRTSRPIAYLLTGLVRCAGCGYAASSSFTNGRRYYRCKPNQNAAPCSAPLSCPADELDELVLSTFEADFVQHTGNARLRAVAATTEVDRLVAEGERLKAGKLAAIRMATMLAASGTPDADAEAEVAEWQRKVRSNEQAIGAAKLATVGAMLPAGVDLQNLRTMPVDEQRRLLSLVYAVVAVRKAGAWREQLSRRVQIARIHQAPLDRSGRIGFVAGLDWTPDGAGVQAA